MSTSLRFMLLGLALLLFGLAFQGALEVYILHFLPLRALYELNRVSGQYALASVFPVAGLVLAFIGFFMRD